MRLLFLVAVAIVAVTGAPAPELPGAARYELDRQYPGWKYAEVAPQIESWFREYRLPFAPNRIAADFDGDSKADYAVRIVAHGRAVTLALMERGGKYESKVLAEDSPDPFTYLLLYRKGEKDFDFTKLKPFRHVTDGIGLMYFDKTPLTFRFLRGRFHKMLSLSDEEVEQ